MAGFGEAFILIIGAEGGYVNNPQDPGGETNFGVSKRSYPNEDIANLTIERAQAIYRADFWDKIAGDSLPPPLALIVMDSAVNNGPSRAARWLQQAVGVAQDGIIGPVTLAAIGKHQLAEVIVEFQARRTLFMLTLPTVGGFGLGWSRRLFHVTLACLAFEDKPTPPYPLPPPRPIDPALMDAIEVTMRKVLEDRAYQQAINQRPPP